MSYSLGWIPSIPDIRDYQFRPAASNPADLGQVYDLRPGFPPVYNQSSLGSCVWNALAGLVQFDQGKQGEPLVMPSRLYGYYNTRLLEGTVGSDSGCQIRDAIKVLNTQGVCSEALWPYIIQQFTAQPPAATYDDGAKHKSILYQAVQQDELHITAALAQGYPIILGITLYESFESPQVAATGIVPMPQPSEGILGGHGIVICGINRTDRTVIIRNSWGNWGINGYCIVPLDYILNPNLADDLWIVETIQ